MYKRQTVTSVLYEVNSYSVTLEAGDVEFRARLGLNPKPEVGDRVTITISEPLVYVHAPDAGEETYLG